MVTCNIEGHALGIYDLDPSIFHLSVLTADPNQHASFPSIISITGIPTVPVICVARSPSYLLAVLNYARFIHT